MLLGPFSVGSVRPLNGEGMRTDWSPSGRTTDGAVQGASMNPAHSPPEDPAQTPQCSRPTASPKWWDQFPPDKVLYVILQGLQRVKNVDFPYFKIPLSTRKKAEKSHWTHAHWLVTVPQCELELRRIADLP